MKVKELIEELKKWRPETEVRTWSDDGGYLPVDRVDDQLTQGECCYLIAEGSPDSIHD